MLLLVSGDRRTRQRSEDAIDVAVIVALIAENGLDLRHFLARIHFRRSRIDRPIIIIGSVRIVSPGGLPVTSVPIIRSAEDEDDVRVIAYPPIAIVPNGTVVTKHHIFWPKPGMATGNMHA